MDYNKCVGVCPYGGRGRREIVYAAIKRRAKRGKELERTVAMTIACCGFAKQLALETTRLGKKPLRMYRNCARTYCALGRLQDWRYSWSRLWLMASTVPFLAIWKTGMSWLKLHRESPKSR